MSKHNIRFDYGRAIDCSIIGTIYNKYISISVQFDKSANYSIKEMKRILINKW